MPDTKKKSTPQTHPLEIAGIADLQLKSNDSAAPGPSKGIEKPGLNQDLIHKLIDFLKKN